MLKIKDSVDLKELEKFGFVDDGYHYKQLYEDDLILVEKNNRKICIRTCDIVIDSLDIIYSLIKADLVEKVENDRF